MMRFIQALGGLLLATALASCGGGGGSPGLTPDSLPPGELPPATPAALEVFTSSSELTSATNSSITFNVAVKDANNQAIPGQKVSFSSTSGNLIGALPTPTTGANGEPITTVSLSPGADRSNRSITVTVTAGGISEKVTIPVTGTTLSLSGASFVLTGASTTFTVKATDSAGQPVSGAALTATSALRNSIAPTSLTTNTQGAATFVYTGTVPGADTVTITGLGSTATAPITVSGDQFTFDAPATGASITVNTPQTITVRYLIGGAPQVGKTVTFSTTRGNVSPVNVITDATGRASTTVTSSSSGPANLVAQSATAEVTLPVTFVAVTPATLVLQANPAAVPTNAPGNTTNQAALQATVRDASGNPVAGKIVNFTAVRDPSNGSISPGTATTDASGTAVAQFISGPLNTANNGVVVQATVQGTAVSGTAALTVNAAALFIAINTGNEIQNADPTTYRKEFSVAVTDANGAPAVAKVVTLAVYPKTYGKGRLVWDNVNETWTPNPLKTCPNEDLNRDGILQAGEDINGNGKLEPGLPVIVAPATVTTDSAGRAIFALQYGENYVPWVTVDITASAGVAGTESVRTQEYALRGATEDFSTITIVPAGVRSPFGVIPDCTTPD